GEMAAPAVAEVPAGGDGARLAAGRLRQRLELGGRPLPAHAIAAFDAHARIGEDAVVMAPGHLREAAPRAAPTRRAGAATGGGATRTATTAAALRALAERPDDDRVLFHGAPRAVVDGEVIDRVLAALDGGDEAVAVGVPASDTMVVVEDGVVVSMPPRETMTRFQTPQGFRLGTIRKAYESALADPELRATDDCGVVHRYLPEVTIRVVEGSERNFKVTRPLDVVVAEHLASEDP